MVSLRRIEGADGRVVLHDVSVRYGRRLALEAVSGEFRSGSMTAVVGANGAGKSTLLMAIADIVPLAHGRVTRGGRQPLGYLLQHAAIDREFPLTVSELIALGGWSEFGLFRAAGASLRARATAAAETVGLAAKLALSVRELSAGELQRALFARPILQDPAVILLDEPLAAVDAPTVSVLLAQMMRWHEEGRTVIAVLHDLARARAHFPSALVLARRCLAWGNTEAALLAIAA